MDDFDMQQEERMWPTVDDQAIADCTDPECQVCEQPDDEPEGSYDLSDDADALASAGMGTDEDYSFESYE